MTDQKKVLVLDAGNSLIKVAVFYLNEIVEIHRFKNDDLLEIKKFYSLQNNPETIISSVLSKNKTLEIAEICGKHILVDQKTPIPINIEYETPQTLGIDRICNIVALSKHIPEKRAVSIDIGTCVKFDMINEKATYLGGSISPGIHLRYKSLNDYTANLPLLNNTDPIGLIGRSTKESIHSGVMNGIQAEIIEMIRRYEKEYEDLTFFMTGGDMHFFDIPRKNNIFVDENLTLKGLYQIYLFNAH